MTAPAGSGQITLLTDFGWRDGYVAAMKGVMASVAPGVRVLDAAHDLAAHDVRSAGWVLHQFWKTFPAGTIHVAVVDPGVGTERHGLILRADGHWLIGPDNGIFSWVVEWAAEVEIWRLRPDVHVPAGLSDTFHGRDVFAYAAGLLAAGVPVEQLASPTQNMIRMREWTQSRQVSPDRIEGEIVHTDRFGNCVTNIAADDWNRVPGPTRMLEVRSYFFSRLHRTYADVEPGRKLILVGSSGYIEIAVREGNAARRMLLHNGEAVSLTGTGSEHDGESA
ncbi:MAG: SAM-dependent chlorinase/fluorinase [Kiritimatiellae bacterium]|nr:SAM-dependent chlorinase/fluorinase [Kiritimatiellia bacterium]